MTGVTCPVPPVLAKALSLHLLLTLERGMAYEQEVRSGLGCACDHAFRRFGAGEMLEEVEHGDEAYLLTQIQTCGITHDCLDARVCCGAYLLLIEVHAEPT